MSGFTSDIRDKANKQLREVLNSSSVDEAIKNLPPLFREVQLIVDPLSSEGTAFQKYMEKIAHKVAPNHTKPVIYLLSDTTEEVGYTVPGNAMQLVVISKGLFEFFKDKNTGIGYEDRIGFVLGHEIGHDQFGQSQGDVENSIEQERDCDRFAIEGMLTHDKETNTYAYNINEAVKALFQAVSGDILLGTVIGLQDVHGVPQLRADAAKLFVAGKLSQLDNMPEPKPYSAELLHILEHGKYSTYEDRFKANNKNYEDLAPEMQLGIIGKEMAKIEVGMEEGARYLSKLINAMPLEKGNLPQRRALIGLTEAMVNNPASFNMWPIIGRKLKSIGEYSLLPGKMKDVAESIEKFVQPANQQEAHQAAEHLTQFFDAVNTRYNKISVEQIDWPNFEVSKEQIANKKAPWMQHVRWAHEGIKNNDYTIAKALWYLGIAPTSLFDVSAEQQIKQWKQYQPISTPAIDSHAHTFENLVLDREGGIRGVSRDIAKGAPAIATTYHKQLYDSIREQEKENRRTKQDKQAPKAQAATDKPSTTYQPILKSLQKVSAEEVAENLPGIIEGNRNYLTSPWKNQVFKKGDKKKLARVWDWHYEAVNTLIGHFRTLIAKDKEKYAPLIKDFFLTDSGYGAKELLDASQYGRPTAISSSNANSILVEEVLGRIAMSVHPFAQFVINDPEKLFSPQEKIEFTTSAGALLPLQEFQPSINPILDRPLTKDELIKTLDQYTQNGWSKGYPTQVFAGRMIANHLAIKPNQKNIVELMLRYPDFFTYAADNNVAVSGALEKQLQHVMRVTEVIQGVKDREGLSANIKQFLAHDVTKSENIIRARKSVHAAVKTIRNWPDKAEDLISLYHTMEAGRLFPAPEYQKSLSEKVLDTIEAISAPEERMKLLNHLMSRDIKAPPFRNQVEDLWAQTIYKVIGGKDPGYSIEEAKNYAAASDEEKVKYRTSYHQKLVELIDPINSKKSIPEKISMFAKLADVLETQQEISEYLGSVEVKFDRESIIKAANKITLSEMIVELVNNIPATRRSTIDFLTAPLSSESVTKYAGDLDEQMDIRFSLLNNVGSDLQHKQGKVEELDKEQDQLEEELETIDEAIKSRQADGTDKGDLPKAKISIKERLREINATLKEIDKEARQISKQNQEEYDNERKGLNFKKFKGNPCQELELVELYENFWSAPILARVAIVDQLLTSATQKSFDFMDTGTLLGENFRESMEYTIGKVVPSDSPHADLIKTMLRAYTLSVDESQTSLFIAAALAANKKGQEAEKPWSAAEVAANILMSMGPFERKICQAISNSPELDPEIARPFAEAKGEGLKQARWHDIERFHDVTTDEFRAPIQRIGKRLGGASIYTSYEMHEHNGSKRALGFKEDNALSKTKRGETIASKFVNNLRVLDPNLADRIPKTLEDILVVAGHMTREELDADVGRMQHMLLPKLYDGITVTINRLGDEPKPYHISSARMLAYGDDFRYTTMVEGEHFENIEQKLNATKAEKQDLAIAHLTPVLRNWLGGVPEEIRGYYDTDDHDAQGRACRAEDGQLNHYGRFDPGGINLRRRTDEETRQLANTLFDVLIDHLGGKPLATSMHDHIKEIRDADPDHRTPEHLIAAQRTLLALSNFIKEAGNANVIRIMASLYHANQIDPVIKDVLEDRLRSSALQGSLMAKVTEFMSAGKIDGQVMEALGEFATPPQIPFVTISQEPNIQVDEPTYVKLPSQEGKGATLNSEPNDAGEHSYNMAQYALALNNPKGTYLATR